MHGRTTALVLIAAGWLGAHGAPARAAEIGLDPLTGRPTDAFGRTPNGPGRPEFIWPQPPSPEAAPMPPLAEPLPDVTAPAVAASGPSLLSQQAASDARTRAAFQRRQEFLRQQRLNARPRGN